MSQNELLPCGCGELEYVHIKVVAYIRKGIVGVVECQRCGEVVSFVSIGTAFPDEFTDDAYTAWNHRIAAAPASEAKGQCCEHAGTFLCHCGKFTLIEKPPTVESIAEMKHLLCWAYDNLNDMPVSDEWAAGWCKEFGETEFGKTLMCNEPAASSAAGECKHEWSADPDAEVGSGWVYCPKCDCSRRTSRYGEPVMAEQDQAGELQISHQCARVMLDSMDDCARMSCGVDAKGPRETLEKYIDQQEALLRRAARVEVTDAMRKRASEWLSTHGGYWDDDYVNRLLTAALEPKE